MAKAKIVRDSDGLFDGIKFNCPACLWSDGTPQAKVLPVSWLPPGETQESPHVAGKPHWGFNGDFENPTLTPSVLQWWGGEGTEVPKHVCHSFVTNGRIQFLGDCTHALAGQTVDLPAMED
ncbi:DUF6527 family protein [Cupriavidus necator]|uniref:Ammonia monooxygenase n=1 Tax=Cupriavidus pinatubonensis (strain JMP 134 / LMG 1197) TaxID=264198 RepID=Q46YN0_CUPPJ|nr:DUF6527 family protein [Cupriavidus necator]